MTILALILAIVFVVTLVFAAIPFLLFPVDKVREKTGCDGNLTTIRLLGYVVAALLASYGFGFLDALGGWIPTGVLITGIVANGGAASVLLTEPSSTARKGGALFAACAVALALGLIAPGVVMRTLF